MKTNPDHKPSPRRLAAAPFIAAVLGAASLTSLSAADQKSQTPIKEASNTRKIVVPVEGMSCVACVARVKNEIAAMPGVAAVNVDLAERNARISFDPTRVTVAQLAAAIDKLGYKAGEPRDASKAK
jgi:copper chaperone CopZ